MSIDREFTFLNQTGNSLNSGKILKESVNEGENKPCKMVDFVKTSTLKYLISIFLLTGGITSLESTGNNDTHSGSEMAIDIQEKTIKSRKKSIKSGISDYFLDIINDGINRNSMILMDDNYNEAYISGIPLDEALNCSPGMHMSDTPKENLYLMKYRKLSIEDYQDMFKGLKNLKQGNLGNCYFVVALKALARSKYFDTLIMTSLEKGKNNSFNLYMPLGEPGGVKVTINTEDLEASTIAGPIGYKILEVGFAKYLLFKKGIIPNPDITMTDELMKRMKSGYPGDAMMTLLGPKSFENNRIEKRTLNNYIKIIEGLKKFDPKNLGLVLVIGKQKKGKTDKDFYEVGGERIYYRHAYCVCGVEKDGNIVKSVTLDNPWNNSKNPGGFRIKLGISDFINNFSIADIGHITDSFLDLDTKEEEIKIVDSIDRSNS